MTPRYSQHDTITSPQNQYDNFVQDMLNGHEAYEGHLVHATVLFIDIRDVSLHLEQTDETHTIYELNQFYADIQQIIYRHGGMVSKCGDEAITALFGAPIPMANHAEKAVRVAMKMVQRLIQLNQKRQQRQMPPLRIGFGVNTGDMIIGHLATARWRRQTLVGETVDIASYISALNKNAPVHTLFASHATAAIIGDRHQEWCLLNLGEYEQEAHDGVKLFAIVP